MGVKVEEKWDYDEVWKKKSKALRFAKDYAKKTKHDVVLEFSSADEGWVIQDKSLKRIGLPKRYVAVEKINNKPSKYVVWGIHGFRLKEVDISRSKQKLKKVM